MRVGGRIKSSKQLSAKEQQHKQQLRRAACRKLVKRLVGEIEKKATQLAPKPAEQQ